METSRARRPLFVLFAGLTLLQLLPIWAVRYTPTVDGPSHVYNASVLLNLVTGKAGRQADFFVINWRPNPNWLSHAVMAAMLVVLPPLLTEKLMISGIILLFLGAAWYYARSADGDGDVYAFLALPLAYHQSLQFGYFNFCIAAGLSMLILAIWWRRRDAPTVRNVALIAALLLLCDSAHPMPTGLTMITISVLWLMTLRGRPFRRHIRHLAAFVPVTPLLVWYMRTQPPPAPGTRHELRYLLEFIGEARFLMTFDLRQFYFGAVLFVLYLSLAIVTIVLERRHKREARAFGLALVVLLVMYFALPSQLGGGLGINDRLAFFMFLVPLAWFTPRISPRLRTILVAALTLASIANVVFHLVRYRRAERVLNEIVRTFDGIDRDSTFVSFIFDARPPRSVLNLMTHTNDYAAVEHHLVDLVNYEAEVGYFPIRYRPGGLALNGYLIATRPEEYDVAGNAPQVDYIFTWKMPITLSLPAHIEEHYRLVREWGNGRLYHRR